MSCTFFIVTAAIGFEAMIEFFNLQASTDVQERSKQEQALVPSSLSVCPYPAIFLKSLPLGLLKHEASGQLL